MDKYILETKDLIDKSGKVTVMTGAGISAESGIQTFRGQQGLWNNFKPEELATPQAFWKDPKLVWEWYDWRRKTIGEAKPNPGHYALVELEGQKSNFNLITQNVDGLHQIAGSKNVIEIHGNIWKIRCTKCGEIETNFDVPLKEIPPTCSKCGDMGRPNVVWFGEMIPMDVIDKSLNVIEECDVLLIVGTSGIVEPAASMGIIAKEAGKKVVEINLEDTPSSPLYDIRIRKKSGEVLPLLCGSPEVLS